MTKAAVIRFPQVKEMTGLSRSTVWRFENLKRNFPQRILLGENSVGWRKAEVEKWLLDRERGVLARPRAAKGSHGQK